MAQLKQRWVAEDGQEFDTEEQANRHDASLKHLAKAGEYIAATGLEGSPAGVLRKHIPQFMAFLDGVMPVKEEPKTPKTPKTPKAPPANPPANPSDDPPADTEKKTKKS